MRDPNWAPLTGFRVAVTSARRAEELSTLLTRRGANVTHAAAITMVPLPDDDEFQDHTEALIATPPDVVIATTGIGFRGWTAAADGWGLAADLITALSKARIVSRGPKATGALRAAGLPEEWSPESESSREVLHYLREGGISGLRIAVQLQVPPRNGIRFPSSSTNCAPRGPTWCRSGCTGGTRRRAAAASTPSWRASPSTSSTR
jgi:uroporphyrinogen-III synthase